MPGRDPPGWQRRMKDDIGENPAQFLDHRLVEYGVDHTLSRMVRDRIPGINCIDVVTAWIALERKLDRGPRCPIISLLEERREFLQKPDERPNDWRSEWPQNLPKRYWPTNRDISPKECSVITNDGKRVPDDHRPTTATVGRSLDSMTTDVEITTEGGESR